MVVAVLDKRCLQRLLPREVSHAGQLVVAAGTGTDVVEARGWSTVVHGPILHAASVRASAATLLQGVFKFSTKLAYDVGRRMTGYQVKKLE